MKLIAGEDKEGGGIYNKGKQIVFVYLNDQLEKECNGRQQKSKKGEGKSGGGREGPVKRDKGAGAPALQGPCGQSLSGQVSAHLQRMVPCQKRRQG